MCIFFDGTESVTSIWCVCSELSIMIVYFPFGCLLFIRPYLAFFSYCICAYLFNAEFLETGKNVRFLDAFKLLYPSIYRIQRNYGSIYSNGDHKKKTVKNNNNCLRNWHSHLEPNSTKQNKIKPNKQTSHAKWRNKFKVENRK